jgi:hypothetical protein
LPQGFRDADRALPGPHDHDKVGRGKLAADHADRAARREPENQQKGPRQRGVQHQKEAAEVHPHGVLEHQQAEGARSALANRIAQDRARMPGIELLVDFQPQPDRHPSDEREAQGQDLLLRCQIEKKMPVLGSADPVGNLKSQRSQDDVRKRRTRPGPCVVERTCSVNLP